MDDDSAAEPSIEDVRLALADWATDEAAMPVVAIREDEVGDLTVRRMMVL